MLVALQTACRKLAGVFQLFLNSTAAVCVWHAQVWLAQYEAFAAVCCNCSKDTVSCFHNLCFGSRKIEEKQCVEEQTAGRHMPCVGTCLQAHNARASRRVTMPVVSTCSGIYPKESETHLGGGRKEISDLLLPCAAALRQKVWLHRVIVHALACFLGMHSLCMPQGARDDAYL